MERRAKGVLLQHNGLAMEERKIYYVVVERNDKGWMKGTYFYANPEDAVKALRKWTAKLIRTRRKQRKRIAYYRKCTDSYSGVKLKCGSIEIGFGEDWGIWERFDIRVEGSPVHESFKNHYSEGFWGI